MTEISYFYLFAANRRAQESEMWARRKAQLERQGVPSDKNDDISPDEKEREDAEKDEEKQHAIKSLVHTRLGKVRGEDSDEQHSLEDFARGSSGDGGAVQKKVRGRGGTGPRIGPSGAYLPDPEIGIDSIVVEEKGSKRKIGPFDLEERKKKRRNESESETSRDNSRSDASTSSDSDSEAEERRRNKRKKRRRKEKESKKDDKKRKKEKRRKEKRKKEKRRREEKSKKQSKERRKESSSSYSSD